MMENPEPAQPADATLGVTNATLGDEDVMIDVEGFYFDHPGEGHHILCLGNTDEGVPVDDTDL